MRLDVPMDDIVIVTVLQGQQNLPHVVTTNGLRVDKPGRGPFDNLEAEVGPGHELEDHVEHALRAVGFQQLHDVRVLEHVTNGGLPLEVVQAQPGTGGEFGHVDDFDGELLARLPMNASSDQ